MICTARYYNVHLCMLSKEEENFIEYWRHNRDKQKRWYKQLLYGLPIAVTFGSAIMLNLFSEWNVQIKQVNRGQLITLMIAVLIIVCFMAIFGTKHKWEQREQHYNELLQKQKKANGE
jgi:sterol desaturase/sphingolipid hydroxylase (fatty acid hydroxylase superfamily)